MIVEPRIVPALASMPALPGHGQLRPSRFGWRFRVSVKGEVWGPWMFTFTRRRALHKLGWFALELLEQGPWP
jgi:hypothetical protein